MTTLSWAKVVVITVIIYAARINATSAIHPIYKRMFPVPTHNLWFCGWSYWNGYFLDTVVSTCPQYRDATNKCCYAHDFCFENQHHSLETCNLNFCECLYEHLYNDWFWCKPAAVAMCNVVYNFSGTWYDERTKEMQKDFEAQQQLEEGEEEWHDIPDEKDEEKSFLAFDGH